MVSLVPSTPKRHAQARNAHVDPYVIQVALNRGSINSSEICVFSLQVPPAAYKWIMYPEVSARNPLNLTIDCAEGGI